MTQRVLTTHTIPRGAVNKQGTPVNPPDGDGWRLVTILANPGPPELMVMGQARVIVLWERDLP